MKPDAKRTATNLIFALDNPSPSKSSSGMGHGGVMDDDDEDDEGSDLSDAAGESAADDALQAMKSGDSAGFYAAMKSMFACMKD